MGLSFVAVTIASLTGVERADAGVASGLINTSRQIGGAVGLAAVSALAASSASAYASAHPGAPSGVALDHGFQTGLVVLTALLVVGAVIAAVFVRPTRTAVAGATSATAEEKLALEHAA